MAGYAEESASPRYGVGLNNPDMERSQHYSLRWNNHQSHVLSAFDNLLQNESLVDCTIMCEDSAVRAHKVVLSACSPYFQKIFTDNPGKHPIIVLKDVRCWEMQCILDFMYKGETSVPEPQLTSLIKAAESLKVRGLTSSDQLPPGVSISASPTNLSNGYRNRGYSPSPSPHDRYSEPSHKLSHMSGGPHSNESSPMSLTHQDQMSDRASGRASPVPGSGNCPRRKQARPRRRSGDSVNSSLDLSKAGSPPLAYTKRESPNGVGDEAGPENLSIRRSHSPGHAPAINLVKMEQLVEDRERRMEDNISDGSIDRDRDCDSKPHHDLGMDRPVLSNGIHHLQEQEALQALNFMASGGGLPHPLLPPPVHSPLHHLHSPHHFQNMSSLHKPTSLPPTSSTPTYTGRSSKGQHSAPRGGPPRSWTNDDLTKALENVWNKRMTTSQASRVFGIPYNSLLMYVRGKYGKSLRLDVLKKNTPAANDNLNTIGNSRSTPKEKQPAVKKEENHFSQSSKDRARKPSQDGMSLFSFDHSGFNPFGNGLLQFPQGEPFGLLGLAGLPPADPRIKDLMQSLQAQQSALSQTERIKEEAFSDTKENNENMRQEEKFNVPFQLHEEAREKALAALLMRAREDCEKLQNNEPKNAENTESNTEEDNNMETIEIPQLAIKPVEVLPITSKPLELNIPTAANEISAQ